MDLYTRLLIINVIIYISSLAVVQSNMNTKLTYTVGWGLFFFGTIGGAVYGTVLGKEDNAKRERDNVILKAEMQRELARIAAKREAEGRPSKLLNAAKKKQAEMGTKDDQSSQKLADASENRDLAKAVPANK